MDNHDIKQWLDSAQDDALGQAASRQMRAWHRLQPALWGETSHSSHRVGSGFWASRLLTLGAIAAIAVAVGIAFLLPGTAGRPSYASAQQPDIYATTFYSSQAHADVVWISGLQSADETENTP